MAYSCELSSGQHIYLESASGQTTIAISSRSRGQQQQSSRTFETGDWTSQPELWETDDGAALKLTTVRGEIYIQIQGSSTSLMSDSPALNRARPLTLNPASDGTPSMKPMEPMEPMEPMKPMKPMNQGNLEGDRTGMEMRMGNREMRMGASKTQSTRRFCSHCGTSISPEDRFCSSCGHQLR